MANAMVYVELKESLVSSYVHIARMIHENDLEDEYGRLVEILKRIGIDTPTLEEFEKRHVLVDVKYDGRKKRISESDVLKALENENYLKKVGDSMFGGFYVKTDKLKVRKETSTGRLLEVNECFSSSKKIETRDDMQDNFRMKPNIVMMREDFPTDGEAYVVGEQMGRHFFAWGSDYPFADELPSDDITNGESGIEWFGTEEDALLAYLGAVNAVQDSREE